MPRRCSHRDLLVNTPSSTTTGCEECLKTGQRWVQLRMCQSCGHIGCCDSSPGHHATAHFHRTEHPAMKSYPDQSWAWCYVDETYVYMCPKMTNARDLPGVIKGSSASQFTS